jgi:hypothetical protein
MARLRWNDASGACLERPPMRSGKTAGPSGAVGLCCLYVAPRWRSAACAGLRVTEARSKHSRTTRFGVALLVGAHPGSSQGGATGGGRCPVRPPAGGWVAWRACGPGGELLRQTICRERIELPNHVPATPELAVCPMVVLAPIVSNRGTKCSGVAWATSTPGALRR